MLNFQPQRSHLLNFQLQGAEMLNFQPQRAEMLNVHPQRAETLNFQPHSWVQQEALQATSIWFLEMKQNNPQTFKFLPKYYLIRLIELGIINWKKKMCVVISGNIDYVIMFEAYNVTSSAAPS